MEKHVQVLAILYIVFSILGLIGGAITFFAIFGGGLISGDSEAIWITSVVATSIALLIFVLSIPGLIGGFGLLRFKNWARILIIILGIINLLNIPFGTILGVYTLWVLLKQEAITLFMEQS